MAECFLDGGGLSKRMKERGAPEDEVETTVKQAEQFPTKFHRTGFRRNFSFNNMWRGRYYENKQIGKNKVE